ncbi:MAG: hypothetical protein HY401_01525 [Elusimicrobia bacterium]|nr:hypothetical protein [Elusimicrobiota bacterium]
MKTSADKTVLLFALLFSFGFANLNAQEKEMTKTQEAPAASAKPQEPPAKTETAVPPAQDSAKPAEAAPEPPAPAAPPAAAEVPVPPTQPPAPKAPIGCAAHPDALVTLYQNKTEQMKKFVQKCETRLRASAEQEAMLQAEIDEAAKGQNGAKDKKESAKYKKQVDRLSKQLMDLKKGSQKLCKDLAWELGEIAKEHIGEIRTAFKEAQIKMQTGE